MFSYCKAPLGGGVIVTGNGSDGRVRDLEAQNLALKAEVRRQLLSLCS